MAGRCMLLSARVLFARQSWGPRLRGRQKHPVINQRGNIMTKLLTALVAATFAVTPLTPVALAGEMAKDELSDACKGKKANEEVTVGGKKVKCPAPNKDATKK